MVTDPEPSSRKQERRRDGLSEVFVGRSSVVAVATRNLGQMLYRTVNSLLPLHYIPKNSARTDELTVKVRQCNGLTGCILLFLPCQEATCCELTSSLDVYDRETQADDCATEKFAAGRNHCDGTMVAPLDVTRLGSNALPSLHEARRRADVPLCADGVPRFLL